MKQAASPPPAPAAAHFRDLFIARDKFRYLAWRLSGWRAGREFRGTLRDGTIVRMRPCDWETAYEIFFRGVYRTPEELTGVTRIVDLGGNVGYSCLYWARHYPDARITVFEPHPLHCRILRENLEQNACRERVTLHSAAAGTGESEAMLSDRGIASAVVSAPAADAVPIRTVDFFETVGEAPIDILKIDIEGGEYPILADERFAALAARTRYLVMEYHERAPGHLGGAWCVQRLGECGFRTDCRPVQADIGLIYARRI